MRYTLALDALPSAYACHCHQCQRWSGSAFSLQALVPEAALSVSGPVAVYEKTTEDRVSTQRVCGECHSRIYNTNTRRPGVAVIRAGTLDDSEALECVAHIFTATKQRWVLLPEGVPAYAAAPPPDEMKAALSR
ncbi:GFA family protein [Sphingomonas sp. CA1-15]|uniref:GFA family protein n=1 Tax=Sphingomonas immobilis TaxID=3063997 RepID=A0ABT8ZZT5_9SPHN|nr:GFA family protein [Sphingomonas sp. CA1-15]MDO7842793.1 GFA family protein [Sphingomonas sp. CA1-15]